jgi:predicted transposase YdaD
MPGPYDSLFKEVLLRSPRDLARFIGIDCDSVIELNSDVASSGRSVDMLVRLRNPNCLVQIEMQTTYDRHMPKRLLEYRILCGLRRKSLPTMRSVLLLMCPKADGAALTGIFEQEDLTFSYEIIRLWEMDVSQLFNMSVYLMPLAPLCAPDVRAIPDLLSRMDDRLRDVQVSAAEKREIWSKTNILMGL